MCAHHCGGCYLWKRIGRMLFHTSPLHFHWLVEWYALLQQSAFWLDIYVPYFNNPGDFLAADWTTEQNSVWHSFPFSGPRKYPFMEGMRDFYRHTINFRLGVSDFAASKISGFTALRARIFVFCFSYMFAYFPYYWVSSLYACNDWIWTTNCYVRQKWQTLFVRFSAWFKSCIC